MNSLMLLSRSFLTPSFRVVAIAVPSWGLADYWATVISPYCHQEVLYCHLTVRMDIQVMVVKYTGWTFSFQTFYMKNAPIEG